MKTSEQVSVLRPSTSVWPLGSIRSLCCFCQEKALRRRVSSACSLVVLFSTDANGECTGGQHGDHHQSSRGSATSRSACSNWTAISLVGVRCSCQHIVHTDVVTLLPDGARGCVGWQKTHCQPMLHHVRYLLAPCLCIQRNACVQACAYTHDANRAYGACGCVGWQMIRCRLSTGHGTRAASAAGTPGRGSLGTAGCRQRVQISQCGVRHTTRTGPRRRRGRRWGDWWRWTGCMGSSPWQGWRGAVPTSCSACGPSTRSKPRSSWCSTCK